MYFRKALCALFLLLISAKVNDSHPQCLDFKPPFRPSEHLEFCGEYHLLSCCNYAEDQQLRGRYSNIFEALSVTDRQQCGTFIRDMLCQKCSPYAAHLFDAEDNGKPRQLPGLCNDYCHIMFKCKHLLGLIADGSSVEFLQSLENADVFCNKIAPEDLDYCYPELIENSLLNDNIGTVSFYQQQSTCVKMCVKEVANNLYTPVSMKFPQDGTSRIFISELRGVIWIYLPDWTKLSVPFLDIQEVVANFDSGFDERGFLDIEFHPDYKNNGLFYAYYSFIGENDHIRISEMRVDSTNMNRADTGYERVLLEQFEPEFNHNGGQLLFGDDGYLYISIGDGGGAGDKFGKYGNAQNTSTLLGKVLRIDVNKKQAGRPYAIPPDNPFVHNSEFLPEIFAYGVRNMWRCSKDRGDANGKNRGRIICGDVGQNKHEEVDILKKGKNYGWRAFEGFACFDKKMCKQKKYIKSHTKPIFAYSHRVGKSITGGHVYRGCENPNWYGYYFLGDFMNGRMLMLKEGQKTWKKTKLCLASSNVCKNDGLQSFYSKYINSFGEDEAGELYFLSSTLPNAGYRGGSVYKLVDPSLRGNPEQCQRNQPRVTLIANETELLPYVPNAVISEIKLVGDGDANRGKVEILHNGEWGSICNHGWTLESAHVVCRSLGYFGAMEVIENIEAGSDQIWLNNVTCDGTEAFLDECFNGVWGQVDGCEQVAGVICEDEFVK